MESIRNSIQQGNERMILVRSVNENDDKIQCGNVEESYRREEFHIVDLNLNKIYRNCLPSLPLGCGHGHMVASGKSIFIFGDLKDGLMVRGAWGPAPPMSTPHGYISTCFQ